MKKRCRDDPLVVTVLFGANAAIWLVNAFRWEQNGLAVAAMLMWLTGAVIWGRRAYLAKKDKEEAKS